MEGSLYACKSANHSSFFSVVPSPLFVGNKIMQFMPVLEMLPSSCLHPFRIGDRMPQFSPKGTWSTLTAESLLQCVAISL